MSSNGIAKPCRFKRRVKAIAADLTNEQLDEITELMIQVMDKKQEQVDKLSRKVNNEYTVSARRVSGALKNCIDAHGPITSDLIPSAAKRLYSAFTCS